MEDHSEADCILVTGKVTLAHRLGLGNSAPQDWKRGKPVFDFRPSLSYIKGLKNYKCFCCVLCLSKKLRVSEKPDLDCHT